MFPTKNPATAYKSFCLRFINFSLLAANRNTIAKFQKAFLIVGECRLGVHGKNLFRFREFKSRPLHSNLRSGTLATTCRQFLEFKVFSKYVHGCLFVIIVCNSDVVISFPLTITALIFCVFLMSSKGLASSKTRSAIFPLSTVP